MSNFTPWRLGEPITATSMPVGASVWTGETPLARAWLDAGGDPVALVHDLDVGPVWPELKP